MESAIARDNHGPHGDLSGSGDGGVVAADIRFLMKLPTRVIVSGVEAPDASETTYPGDGIRRAVAVSQTVKSADSDSR